MHQSGNIISDMFEVPNKLDLVLAHVEPLFNAMDAGECDSGLLHYLPTFRFLVRTDRNYERCLLVFLWFLNDTPAMKDYVCDASKNPRAIRMEMRETFFDGLSKLIFEYAKNAITREKLFQLVYQLSQTGTPVNVLLANAAIQENRKAKSPMTPVVKT